MDSIVPEKMRQAKKVREDIQKFLEEGGKIEQCGGPVTWWTRFNGHYIINGEHVSMLEKDVAKAKLQARKKAGYQERRDRGRIKVG